MSDAEIAAELLVVDFSVDLSTILASPAVFQGKASPPSLSELIAPSPSSGDEEQGPSTPRSYQTIRGGSQGPYLIP